MKRFGSFILIIFIYLFSFTGAFIFYRWLPKGNLIVNVIIADLIATVIIWVIGSLFKNASVYDPYWSVAPLIMVWPFVSKFDAKSFLILFVIGLWGLRLTFNWVLSFDGIRSQDWRYTQYQTKFPKLWPLVNLFGIHLMPTVIVLGVMIPAFLGLQSENPLNVFGIIAACVSLLGIGLEHFADSQSRRFRLSHHGKVNDSGLWKYSRHPNYLGEITMWWGIFFILLAIDPSKYLFFLGPLANTLLFVFISIPLMEGRQIKNKPDYAAYQAKTSMLLLLLIKEEKEPAENSEKV
jgi:steroid 5-alpha reductase family enzyme